MLEFIASLRQRYQTLLLQLDEQSSQSIRFKQCIEQLWLAEAFLRKGVLLNSNQPPPLQIAMIGATQTGKSSLTNVLLNSSQAGVSPLAGYTVHPQGFCVDVSESEVSGLQQYFGRYQQLEPQQLNKMRYDCYALSENKAQSVLLPPCVLWDTPDFDSIDAEDYKEAVLRTVALADIIVLVLSKEKYADQLVWEMMSAIAPLNQPTLICLNKLTPESKSIVLRSLKEKWQHARQDDFPEVVSLFYQKQTTQPVWDESQQKVFYQLAKKAKHYKHFRHQQQYLNQYWDQWLKPVLAEHRALENWQSLVTKAIDQALNEYKRDYLDHPHHYETFQHALTELLNLLEIPGIAKSLAQTRRVLTWPIRKLIGLRKPQTQNSYTSQELVLLNQVAEHLMIQIADQLLEKMESDKANSGWWKENSHLLRHKRAEILQDFKQLASDYHANFQEDVEAAAQQLYKKLEQQPLALNSLRATRITTDAVVMALVIQSGGIGLHDLVITPAMLSLTSLLTETAIGSYMHKVEAQLKQHQLNTVKTQLFSACLHNSLYPLPEQMNDNSRFNISPEELQRIQPHRINKRHGLQIL